MGENKLTIPAYAIKLHRCLFIFTIKSEDKMKRFFVAVMICYFSLFLMTQLAFAIDKPTIFVSILPQKYFVQQISMDHVNIEVMVHPGASPATYEPKASQMKQLASTGVYFAIGAPFEHAWLEKIAGVNPEMEVVHTDDGISKLAMTNHQHNQEHHEDAHHDAKQHKEKVKGYEEHAAVHHEEEHNDHAGLDPHIWLSPSLVKKQAAIITDALAKILPEKKELFQQNFDVFARQIDVLNEDLRTTFKGKKGMKFMVFHPTWGYFAHDYGLEQIAIEIEGKGPKPAQLRHLIELAREHDIHVVFVQPQFSTKSAAVVAREIKGEVIPVNPLAENWLSNMRVVADKLKNALR